MFYPNMLALALNDTVFLPSKLTWADEGHVFQNGPLTSHPCFIFVCSCSNVFIQIHVVKSTLLWLLIFPGFHGGD